MKAARFLSFMFSLSATILLLNGALQGQPASPKHRNLLAPAGPASSYIFGTDSFGVGVEPVSIATGDFNGDGILDMVVTNSSDNTISVLLGKPDGTFAPQVTYPTEVLPVSVVAGDFNGDGNLDLAVVNENCVPQQQGHNVILVCGQGTVSIFFGNGDGTFQPHIDYATGLQPVWVAAGDFNGDGQQDLVVANDGCVIARGYAACEPGPQPGSVSVLLGNGGGGFQPQVSYPTANGPLTVVVADFNGDHKLDIATSTSLSGGGSPGEVSILLGNGDGTFQSPLDFNTESATGTSLVAADFNGDGHADLAVAGNSGSVSFGFSFVSGRDFSRAERVASTQGFSPCSQRLKPSP